MLYSKSEIVKELKRELGMRYKVYPKLAGIKPIVFKEKYHEHQVQKLKCAADILDSMTEKEFRSIWERSLKEPDVQGELFI